MSKENVLFAILGASIAILTIIALNLTSIDIDECIKRGHLPEVCYSVYN